MQGAPPPLTFLRDQEAAELRLLPGNADAGHEREDVALVDGQGHLAETTGHGCGPEGRGGGGPGPGPTPLLRPSTLARLSRTELIT